MTWFVWNDPELKKLRERTSSKPRWRRWVTVASLSAFFIVPASAGTAAGIAVSAYYVGGVDMALAVLNSEQNIELVTGAIAIIFGAIVGLVACKAWRTLMKRTGFISNALVERILRFGPY